MTDFDYGSESDKLGGVPGVLKVKADEEHTLVVTGPMVECKDRFRGEGGGKPTTKYLLGVYDVGAKARAAVLISWKAKTEWDAENKKRPFRRHVVRYSRTGSGKNDTRYSVVCFSPMADALWAEANNAPPLPLGSVKETADEITRRALADYDPNAVPPAKGTYAHPGAPAAPSASSTPQAAPAAPPPPACGGASNPAALGPGQTADVYADEWTRLKWWLTNPAANLPGLSDHAKKLLSASMTKEQFVKVVQAAGVAKGTVPTVAQLHAIADNALAILRPAPSMAGAMGLDDDSLPF